MGLKHTLLFISTLLSAQAFSYNIQDDTIGARTFDYRMFDAQEGTLIDGTVFVAVSDSGDRRVAFVRDAHQRVKGGRKVQFSEDPAAIIQEQGAGKLCFTVDDDDRAFLMDCSNAEMLPEGTFYAVTVAQKWTDALATWVESAKRTVVSHKTEGAVGVGLLAGTLIWAKRLLGKHTPNAVSSDIPGFACGRDSEAKACDCNGKKGDNRPFWRRWLNIGGMSIDMAAPGGSSLAIATPTRDSRNAVRYDAHQPEEGRWLRFVGGPLVAAINWLSPPRQQEQVVRIYHETPDQKPSKQVPNTWHGEGRKRKKKK